MARKNSNVLPERRQGRGSRLSWGLRKEFGLVPLSYAEYLERLDDDPIYARLCDRCGHLEASADPALVAEHRQCPSCAVRRERHR